MGWGGTPFGGAPFGDPFSTIASLAQQAQTYPVVLAIDIVSVEDGTALHISQLPFTFNTNTYIPEILDVSGFEIQLDQSPLGIMAIPEIVMVLGDAAGTMSSWDNTHFFKGAQITITLLFINPATGTPASSDSQVIFKGICNAPDSVTPDKLTLSAYSRFNAEFLLIPISRISIFSQTGFPGDGAQDCDDANSSTPANASSAGFQWLHAEGALSGGFMVPQHGAQDFFSSYFSCGYGPLRGHAGWGGGNPLGNFVVAQATATAGLCSSTTIGNSGAAYPASNGLANNIVAIVSGTGAGQERRILSNTTTQITVGKAFTVTPDGTSQFVVLFGFCSKDPTSCQARGMYSTDSLSRTTARFQGIQFLPFQTSRGNVFPGEKGITINPDDGKFNTPIPLIYGTVAATPVELFSLTGNFNKQQTRGQYLVCLGPIQAASVLVVGGTEVVQQKQSDFSTGVSASGDWTFQAGVLGQNFTDPFFPQSDPHSGMAVVFAKFPPQFLTNVPGGGQSYQVQITGLPLWTCDALGNLTYSPGQAIASNPAWIILDVLMRAGWKFSEINLSSFYAFAVYASQLINVAVSSSQTTPLPRYALGFIIAQQAPASEVIRSLLGACHGLLTYDTNGLLRIDSENRLPNTTLAVNITSTGMQWVTVEDGSGITIGSVLSVGTGGAIEQVTVTNVQLDGTGMNFEIQANFSNLHSSTDPVVEASAYAFDLSSILLNGNMPDATRTSLKTSQTPNEFVVEFQDSMRSFVTDSVDVLNAQEANNFGAALIGSLPARGFTTVDAAARIGQLELYRGHGRRDAANRIVTRGNLFFAFSSSVKALPAAIGKIVTVTYTKEGWSQKAFRVVNVSPTQKERQFPFWKITLTLREHDDTWYDVVNGNIAPPPATVKIPPVPAPPGSPKPVGPRRVPIPPKFA